MQKILFISSTLKRTGPTNILYNLLAELDRSRFEPIVLTLSAEDPRFPSLWESFVALNIRVSSFNFSRIKGFLEGEKEIKKFVLQNNIDVVHIYGFRGDLMVKGNLSKTVKVISTINSNIFDDYTMLYGKYKGRIMAYLHIKSLKGKVAVACSQFVADELNKRYNVNLKVIYNGIPSGEYTITTIEEKMKIREELAIPLNKKIFIFVGYLIYRKDPLTVINAFLNSNVSKTSILLMIGDGPLMEKCTLECKENNSVMFFGNQPSTISFLKASDFYISSAYSEGLPTSVMEAMGCGLPVILSNINPHEELVANINNWQYLFEINDHNELSKKMENIIEGDYTQLSTSCRSVISNVINSNIMSSNYQLLYKK